MIKPTLIEILATNGGITAAEAEAVIAYYRKIKVLKVNAHDGYRIVHGGFFDREVIRRALARI